MNLTPLEKATGIIINSPNDIIMDWVGTSLLIYCYKNDKNLIEWLNLLPDEFIENCVEKELSELSDQYAQDFLQIGMYLNLMKKGNWFKNVKEKDIIKTINMILAVSISMESLNRTVIKQWGTDTIPGSGKIVNMSLEKSNKWDLESYAFQLNPKIKIIDKRNEQN